MTTGLQNLKKYPDDECYQIKDKIYRNKDLYKYVCNIYGFNPSLGFEAQ